MNAGTELRVLTAADLPPPARMFCWHCEQRIIGKLGQPTPGQPFPNCVNCPTWDAGCAQAECEECG